MVSSLENPKMSREWRTISMLASISGWTIEVIPISFKKATSESEWVRTTILISGLYFLAQLIACLVARGSGTARTKREAHPIPARIRTSRFDTSPKIAGVLFSRSLSIANGSISITRKGILRREKQLHYFAPHAAAPSEDHVPGGLGNKGADSIFLIRGSLPNF